MTKNGLDYFSFDVCLDDKFALIEAEFGLTGFAVVVKLLQKIYGQQGYYCEWNEDVALLFSRQHGLGCNVVSEIIKSALKRGIFDKTLYDKYSVLTSKDIQERYLVAAKRRISVDMKAEYLLINAVQNYKNVNILSDNVYISSENVNSFEQSKVKESKVKESKVKEKENKELLSVVVCYENNISPITQVVRKSINNWLSNMESDVIIWAIQEAVKLNKRNWKYIEGILRNQFNAGNKTLADIKSSEKSSVRTQIAEFEVNKPSEYDHAALERQIWANIQGERHI